MLTWITLKENLIPVLNICRSVGQSTVIERAFQQLRSAESKSPNGSIGNHGKYDVLVTSQKLQDEHRYTSLPIDHGVVPRNSNARLPDHCFSSKAKASASAALPMSEIVGYNAAPKWYSPGASHISQRHADVYMTREFQSRAKLGDMRRSWLSTLANSPRVLLRRKTWPADEWVFSLGESFGSVVFTWPAQTHLLGDVVVFTLKTDLDIVALVTALEPVVFADVDEWEGKTFTWLPKWLQQQRYGQSVSGICALAQAQDPVPLMHLAAHEAFYKMPMVALQALAKEMNPPCALPPGLDIAQVVIRMVRHVLGDLPEEQLTDILQKRVPPTSVIAFLDLEPEVEELLLSDDRKDLAEAQGAEEKLKKVDDIFKAVVVARRRDHFAKQEAAAKAAARGRGRGGKGRGRGRDAVADCEPAWLRLRWPVKAVPEDAHLMESFTEKEAQELLPPLATIHRDHFNGRWRVSLGAGLGDFSRSWKKYGFLGSYKLVCAWSWRTFLQHAGRSLKDCPFYGKELDLENIV